VVAGKSLIRLAIFGSPVARSMSPVIHPQFAAQFGLHLSYDRIESGNEDFTSRINEFAATGGTGCNITAPLKQAAFELVHEASPAAAQALAVNTVVFRGPNDWFGHNTDGDGFLRDLLRQVPGGLQGSRILVVGAGGAAKGILAPLLSQQPATLLVANRDAGKAEELVRRFADAGPVASCALAELGELGELAGHAAFDLVINATSLGHHGAVPLIARECFSLNSFCYDLNYGTAADPWSKACTEQGMAYSDGLGMLVEQAALSFEIWTGRKPETQVVLAQLRQRLAT
jgi:shikimate dehydrogenase